MRLRQIGGHFAWNARIAEHRGNVMRARFRPAIEFSHHYLPVIQVMNHAGRDPIQADKAQPTHNLFSGKQASQSLFVSQSVLQSQYRRVWRHQRRQ